MLQIKPRLDELFDYYTGPAFKGCNASARGYSFVRAVDEECHNGLFEPFKAVVNYTMNGPHDISIEVTGYALHRFSFRIQDKSDDQLELYSPPLES